MLSWFMAYGLFAYADFCAMWWYVELCFDVVLLGHIAVCV
jgi:hypothetical protein